MLKPCGHHRYLQAYLSSINLTICWVSLVKIMSNANAAASSSQTIPENLLEAFLDATPNYKPCPLTNLAPFPWVSLR
jgi:hypothetical protein